VSSAILTLSFWRLSGMGLVETLRPRRADLDMALTAIRHMLKRKTTEPQGEGEAAEDTADVLAREAGEEL